MVPVTGEECDGYNVMLTRSEGLTNNLRGFVVSGNGHLTDNCQDVIFGVILGEEDLTGAPAATNPLATLVTGLVVAVFLPVAVIVHQHLVAGPLVEERNLEL